MFLISIIKKIVLNKIYFQHTSFQVIIKWPVFELFGKKGKLLD